MPTTIGQSTTSNTGTATGAPLDANLQSEIARIDEALASHPGLVDQWLNTVHEHVDASDQSGSDVTVQPEAADAKGTAQEDGATVAQNADGAHEGQDDGATVAQNADGAHENHDDGAVQDAANQHDIALDPLKSLVSDLHTGADGKLDFSALNAYLAAHAEQAHALAGMIDDFDANNDHPGNGDGADSDGTHGALHEVNDASPLVLDHSHISLVGVAPSIDAGR